MSSHETRTCIPSYRLHKPSGQGTVRLGGRDFYLGRHGSPGSHEKYNQLIAQWLSTGQVSTARSMNATPAQSDLRINELFMAYWRHVEVYYVKQGQPSEEQNGIKQAMRPLLDLYGSERVVQFGPLLLQTVRQRMIECRLSRNTINQYIRKIVRMFKWGVAQELVPAEIHHALQAVEGLRKGRSAAKETPPVKPAPKHMIEAVIPHVSFQVAAMIQIQRLTGMRSGELVIMRTCDLNMNGGTWNYTPHSHKTEHHDLTRVIAIGPKAQQILRPFLRQNLTEYLFNPSEAEAARRHKRTKQRKTPLSCGNRVGSNRQAQPERQPRDRYTRDSYRRAIERGLTRAYPPPERLRRKRGETMKKWSDRLTPAEKQELKDWRKMHHWFPHQLRHSAATEIRKQFGIEAARVVLGHSSTAVTEVYAELDLAKAADIMAQVG